MGLVEDELPGSSRESLVETLAGIQSLVEGRTGMSVVLNTGLVLLCQALATLLAIALDGLGLPDATMVIVFVLGVLVTTILTNGLGYSVFASLVSILSYNFFLIAPRFSLAIDGPGYVGTIGAMIAFALLANYLVSRLRRIERQSTEASLVAQREQLRANMLRSVSHDLRTPLTSIIGDAEMLLDEETHLEEDSRRQLVTDIRDDATWLRTMVENLLAVTRIEDGNVSLDTGIELVDDVIEEAMRHVSRNAEGHQIMVEPSRELLLANMDPQVIVQVIVNLVDNAIAHTQPDSTITISSMREGPMVAISVADDGPGIADEDKSRIFELFYTGGGADSTRGTGIGLALCRSVVEAHGGTIRVEDVDPHGSRFVFTLPAEEVIAYV